MRSMMQLSSVSRRTVSTASFQALRTKPFQPSGVQTVSRVARRGYADAAPTPSPAPKPKKRFRFLRWFWRLTWLSGLGLTGTLAYSIYSLRHPVEQVEPDPSKKTLVILGTRRLRS
jgi:NADH:ubiquinone reductase (non-electrogenic)